MYKLAFTCLTFLIAVVSAARADGFAGSWETTYGPMTLTQEGDKVKGFYIMEGDRCTIEGTVEKTKLTFTYREPTASGEGWFELAADGKSFTGKWREKGSEAWLPWTGRRAAPAPTGFAGLWDSSFGRVRLVQEGDRVHGIYAYSEGSSIEGKVEGKKLTFRYKEPKAEGEGWFELTDDGASFTGKWKANGARKWADWNGTRVTPTPGRMWLVVIEANWERSLADGEYNFGSMLKAFFTRTPNVQVRHRFFADEADLRRWLSEVPYLAEPTVVVISSHGTAQGVQAGGRTIGAKTFVETLGYSSNLRLLHFASCLTMKGELAADIHKGLGEKVKVPISGYTTSVDWAGSAVLEFMYYDLLLARNLEPAAAAEQLVKLLPYAGEKDVEGAPFKAMGFRLVQPKEATASKP